jgi:hypothetical protein
MSGQKVTMEAMTSVLKAIDFLMAGNESEAFAVLGLTPTRALLEAYILVQKLQHFLTGILIHKMGAASAHIALGVATYFETSSIHETTEGGSVNAAAAEEGKPDA